MSGSASISDNKNSVSLGSKLNIYFDRRVPDYDRPPLKAYAAIKYGEEAVECFALVCDRALLPRMTVVDNFIKLNNPALLNMVGDGLVYWPPAKGERYVFVYEVPQAAAKISADPTRAALGLKPAVILQHIVPVFVNLLVEMEPKKLSHGALDLSNMYITNPADDLIDLTIGDMLALPYGYGQAAIYKTSTQALAQNNGCGEGSIADDIYAFGVCIAQMVRTKDPLADKTDEQILEFKMQHGTYAALIEKERFGGALLEMLKGVLQDDPRKRWSVEELSLWHDGRQLTPKQQTRAKVATRPIEFNGKKYVQATLLAKDIAKNPADLFALVDNGQLLHWIDRGLGDKHVSARYVRALSLVKGNLKPQEKALLIAANVAIGLNPKNPVMYKGHSLFPAALGSKLIERVEREEDITPLVEMLVHGLFHNWLTMRIEEGHSEYLGMSEMMESCRSALQGKKTGYGIERCIYILAKRVHCLSPLFKNRYVLSARDVVVQIDKKLEKDAGAMTRLIDRHIAAFLLEREPQVIESYVFDMDSPHANEVIHAILSCYASIQKRNQIKALPHLAKAFLKQMQPCYDVFYDRELRKKVEENVKKSAEKGDLPGMLSYIEDIAAINKDRRAYNAALQEYHKLDAEHQEIQMNLIDRKRFNRSFGREISAMITSAIAAVIIMMIAIAFYTSG